MNKSVIKQLLGSVFLWSEELSNLWAEADNTILNLHNSTNHTQPHKIEKIIGKRLLKKNEDPGFKYNPELVSFSKNWLFVKCLKQPSNVERLRVKTVYYNSKAVLVAVLQFTIELPENNLNLYLRVQTTSRQLKISIVAPRIF